LCTERVILNEGRQRKKWIWNRGIGEIILKARRGNYPHGNQILEGETLRGVADVLKIGKL